MSVLITWGAEDRIFSLHQDEKLHNLALQSQSEIFPRLRPSFPYTVRQSERAESHGVCETAGLRDARHRQAWSLPMTASIFSSSSRG